MFKGQGLARPQTKSLFGTAAVIAVAMLGSQVSPSLGYLCALLALVMMLVVSLIGSAWPTHSKRENFLVFSLFWGLMLGAVVPFMVTTFLEGGVSAVIEVMNSEP